MTKTKKTMSDDDKVVALRKVAGCSLERATIMLVKLEAMGVTLYVKQRHGSSKVTEDESGPVEMTTALARQILATKEKRPNLSTNELAIQFGVQLGAVSELLAD